MIAFLFKMLKSLLGLLGADSFVLILSCKNEVMLISQNQHHFMTQSQPLQLKGFCKAMYICLTVWNAHTSVGFFLFFSFYCSLVQKEDKVMKQGNSPVENITVWKPEARL